MPDTIAALATAPGRAALAIVRISGPGTAAILWDLTQTPINERRASVRRLSYNGVLIDEALVLWMPGPNSYSGEDMAELQLHGGPGVVGAALEAVTALGARLAQPGEFTRRAFANGRMDLAQAEAVADLVEAETASQARQALGQLGGLGLQAADQPDGSIGTGGIQHGGSEVSGGQVGDGGNLLQMERIRGHETAGG